MFTIHDYRSKCYNSSIELGHIQSVQCAVCKCQMCHKILLHCFRQTQRYCRPCNLLFRNFHRKKKSLGILQSAHLNQIAKWNKKVSNHARQLNTDKILTGTDC